MIVMQNINKIWILVIIISSILLSFYIIPKPVEAKILKNYKVTSLRAGGGGSSGGSSSGGSSSGSRSTHTSNTKRNYGILDFLSSILNAILMIVMICIGSIVLYIKVLRSSFNSKRYMRMLDDKDITWNYKTVEKQVIDAYYTIEEAWAEGNMKKAKKYMSKDLYENFQTKLGWMEINNQKNILKKIKLLNVKPVSIHDDEDDSKDLIWFYIKGKMIDYTINTETKEMIEGKTYSTSFIEFWKFTRTKKNTWVLSKILQKEEANKIVFQ